MSRFYREGCISIIAVKEAMSYKADVLFPILLCIYAILVLDTALLGTSLLRRICQGVDYCLSNTTGMGWYNKSVESILVTTAI